jgi:hypothetical protein
MRHAVPVFAVLAAVVSAASPARSADLREFTIGEKVAELPGDTYYGFRCADAADHTLSGWEQWRDCPAEPDGLRAVGFRFDVGPAALLNDSAAGTKIGGHPVQIALLFDDAGTLAAIRVETDPSARPFMRKKSFLLGAQFRAHYGEEGWTCEAKQPSVQEQAVGGVFIDERCEKTDGGRHYTVHTAVFRRPDQSEREDVNETEFEIRRAG